MTDEREPLLKSQDGSVSVSLRSHDRDGDPTAQIMFKNERRKSLVDALEKVTLSWRNVHLCTRKSPKHILRNVYGHVKPGTLLAIIGASGSGKTSLLNILTARTDETRMTASGDIRVNGFRVGTGIRNISAYVQQDDLFIATMTVKEHLTFRALLRMDRTLPRSRRLKRVDEVINELGLQKCQDNIIGDPGRMKGISGGEMRRLSFASEVLTNPPLLFCDEATSGLDSFMAENIVLTLQSMARKGKTILCTIHQPSSDVFALFDHVLIMAEGRVAFMGDSAQALSFYSNAGYPCPMNFNPADFYIKTMAVVPGKEAQCQQRIQNICDRFDGSDVAATIMKDNRDVVENPPTSEIILDEARSSTSRYDATWCQQFGSVLLRSWRTVIREPMVVKVRTAQTIVIAVVLGLIYLRLTLDQKGVQDINGVMFLLLMNMTFSNVFGVLNAFTMEKPIFLREYGVGLYRVDVYFICKTISELPFFIIIPAIFCAITYWMIGLYETFEAFLVFTGVLVLVANISVSFGYIVSTAANSVTTALALAPPLMIPLIMFGGFFLNADSIPVYFIWLEYLSWFKYANELVSINQWQHIDDLGCEKVVPQNETTAAPYTTVTTQVPETNVATATPQVPPGNKCLFPNGEAVIDYLNFHKDNQWLDVGVLAGMMVGYRLIAFIILFIKARRSVRHRKANENIGSGDTGERPTFY